MSDPAALKHKIVATFADVTGKFGAAVKQLNDHSWSAQSSPVHVVELHLSESNAGISVTMRSGAMKAELPLAVTDETTLAKAESFIRVYAPKPLCSDFSQPGVKAPPSRASLGSGAAIQLQGGGSTVELLHDRYQLGFSKRPDGADSILFAFFTESGLKNALLTPDRSGVFQPVKAAGIPSPDSLIQVSPGPMSKDFEIVDLNRRVVVPFPRGCTLHSANPGAAWSFELFVGRQRDEGVLLVRGPFHGQAIPKLSQLTLPDQTVVARSNEDGDLVWVENEYIFESLTFRQFHCYAELDRDSAAIVTAQALASCIGPARELAQTVARSARWMQKHENRERAH